MQFLTLFLVGPALAIAIPYGMWLGKPWGLNPNRSRMYCVLSGLAGVSLFAIAKWIDADVRTPQYFLQLACFLLSGPLFGVFMGCGFCQFLLLWGWHTTTRLTKSDEPD